jgi:hypothetical protein
MYGKIFESTYNGSMVGMGPVVFSVWPYVIAKMKPDRERMEFEIELQPVVLAAIIGKVTADEIERAIELLCAPDPQTSTEGEQGRRLIRTGSFTFRVVNGAKYDRLKNEEDRRRANNESQARRRAKLAEKEARKAAKKAREVAVKDGMQTDRLHEIADEAKNGEI